MKKRWFRFVAVFVVLIASFMLFATLSCWMPDRAIQKHVSQAALTLHKNGIYPNAMIDKVACRQDNFTDAIILNQIFCIDRSHPLKSAMSAVRGCTDNPFDVTGALLKTTRYEQDIKPITYPRYWHGNTFLFRFLLSFMSYSNLQWLMFAVSTLLLIFFVICYYPRAGIWNTLAFVLSWLLVYGFVMQFSMQFFPVLALALICSILIIPHDDNPAYIAMLLFIIGCLTCYFDLLTTPLLTFGWPLAVWISLQRSSTINLKDSLLQITGWGALWGTGYGLTFASKWALGSWILKTNVLQDAADQVAYRMTSSDFTRWDAVTQNFSMLPLSMLLTVLILLCILMVLRFRAQGGTKALLLLMTALLPYVWYLLVANHSYLHAWFTYRLQAVSIAALLMAILSFCSDRTRRFSRR
jgi:hypothetical protein